MKRFAIALLLGWTAALAPTPGLARQTAPTPRPADRIVVDKSERKLQVYVGAEVVATYAVALGLQPVGAKQREGDKKTPEGHYLLDYKKADSAYFRAIHVSYPDRADRERARRAGVPPGGLIMIHGQPNDARVREAIQRWPYPDWTDGCIALSNADMQALWERVRVPTPIEIRP